MSRITELLVATDLLHKRDHSAWVPFRYQFPPALGPITVLTIVYHGGQEIGFQMSHALAGFAQQS